MWTRLWRRAIVLSAGSHLLRDRHLSEYVTGDQAEQLAGFRHLRRLGEAVDVYDAFRITTNGRTRRIPLDDPEWDRFERLVGALLEQAPPITLYVDSLDREFDSAPSYWMRTQEGLLSALLDLINSDRFGARLHTTITVRDMVISSIMRSSHASKILDTGYVRTLNWDPASLGTLLVEKARLLPRSMMCKPELQRSDPVESWLGFSTVANVVRGVDENVTDYLIRHSRFIPRDIVDVGNAICLDIESSPASFTQERFRQIVSRMAQKFGREQLYISAQEIAADLLPPGLDDQSYFGALEHVKTIERCLERLLQEQHNDVLEMDRIRVLTHRIAQVFRPFLLTDGITDATLPSVILNSLWHNRVIGYRYPSTDQRVGCYRFYGVSSDSRFDLPDEDIELAIHPCILDAIPGLRAATSAPVLPDPNSDLL